MPLERDVSSLASCDLDDSDRRDLDPASATGCANSLIGTGPVPPPAPKPYRTLATGIIVLPSAVTGSP